MDFPKFLPVVIEIVIDGDGNKTFICRNSNGVVQQILHDTLQVSSFVDELCTMLVGSVSQRASGAVSVKENSIK